MREDRLRGRLIEMIAPCPTMAVLDLGCGTGSLAIALKRAEPSLQLVGLDPDPDVLTIAVAKARRAGVELELKLGGADSIPSEAMSFDMVVSSLVFHHLHPPVKARALAEIRRVLRPGGRLLIADFGRPRTWLGRVATLPLQLFDGRSNTADNLQGRLPAMTSEAGFDSVAEVARKWTPPGPVCFLTATSPGGA